MHVPDHFEFYNKTKICSGNAALENIPFELESMGAERPFVIADKSAVDSGAVSVLIKSFYNSGITIGALFDEVPGKVSGSSVTALSTLFGERRCDSIIAIGAESAATSAKALNVILANSTVDFTKIRNLDKSAEFKPSVYIPTFEARGSETANELFIDDIMYRSDKLSPDVVVIDKRTLKTSDRKSIASASMFALTQSIEACSLTESNPVNDSFAYASIGMVYDNLADSLRRCFNSSEKLALINGIVLSGIVYSNAGEGIARTLAFEAERETGHPAQICAGIILPYALDYKFHTERTAVRGELLLPLAGIDNYCSVPESERAAKSVELIYLLLDNLEGMIPANLKELGLDPESLKRIAKSAEARTGKRYKKGAALSILQHAYDGTPFKGGKLL